MWRRYYQNDRILSQKSHFSFASSFFISIFYLQSPCDTRNHAIRLQISPILFDSILPVDDIHKKWWRNWFQNLNLILSQRIHMRNYVKRKRPVESKEGIAYWSLIRPWWLKHSTKMPAFLWRYFLFINNSITVLEQRFYHFLLSSSKSKIRGEALSKYGSGK